MLHTKVIRTTVKISLSLFFNLYIFRYQKDEELFFEFNLFLFSF